MDEERKKKKKPKYICKTISMKSLKKEKKELLIKLRAKRPNGIRTWFFCASTASFNVLSSSGVQRRRGGFESESSDIGDCETRFFFFVMSPLSPVGILNKLNHSVNHLGACGMMESIQRYKLCDLIQFEESSCKTRILASKVTIWE